MEEDKKVVGIGVIGAGSIAEIAHFPSISQIDEAELVAACDPVEEYRKAAIEKWRFYSSFCYVRLYGFWNVQIL